ncbi:MAG: ABC transporter ATP-binding protein [Olsenella sp.]|nr:ABC transporter ATP-binding protein [Olsenella sp.]
MGELLKRFLVPYRARAAIGVCAKAVEVVFDLLTPIIVARMIDRGVAARDVGVVVRLGILLVLLALVGYSFTLVCQKMASLVSQGLGTDVRNELYEKIMSLDAEGVDRFGTPSLVTRLTGDVNQIQVAVALVIRQLIRWPFLAVGSMIAACLIDLRLGLVFVVCTPAIGLVFWLVMSRAVPFYRIVQRKLDAVSLVCRETLSGVRVIRAFGRERRERERFRGASDEQASVAIAVGRLSSVLNPSTFLIMSLGIVAILWAGGSRVSVGDLTQGEVVAFVNYMTQTLLSIAYVANLVVVFTRGAASAQRVCEVLDAPIVLSDEGRGHVDLPAWGEADALSLDDVSFAYDGAQAKALEGLSLSLAEGETLGIIGGTGSGKSTLVQLVSRLYDVSDGSVKVLGRDVREYPMDELREIVSVVPQSATLMSGTIRSNLSWRRGDATDEELWHALEVAQAAEFVRGKADGLDEAVSAGGRNFSGGQRQRLTIARALVGDPRILILDDSASALDYATDAALRRALAALGNSLTTILVSQRVSAVMGADKILVLDHGRAVGLGTHESLLETCVPYREICLSQLSKEEVA